MNYPYLTAALLSLSAMMLLVASLLILTMSLQSTSLSLSLEIILAKGTYRVLSVTIIALSSSHALTLTILWGLAPLNLSKYSHTEIKPYSLIFGRFFLVILTSNVLTTASTSKDNHHGKEKQHSRRKIQFSF